MTSLSLDPFLALYDALAHSSVSVELLQLHRIYPRYSGNKDYKLRNINLPKECSGVVTFGGIWSNHLLAVSRFASDKKLSSIAIVRNPHGEDNALLKQCRSNGMAIISVSYEEYRARDDQAYLEQLSLKYPKFLILPEGGSTAEALVGCKDIASDILKYCRTPSHVVCAVGTGCTVAGIRAGLPASVRVEGEATTKKYAQQQRVIGEYSDKPCSVFYTPESGRYGQLKPELLDFIVKFETEAGVALDPNYSAKALFACFKRISEGLYPEGSHIVVVHTGGLVGRLGYPELIDASPLGAGVNL